MSHDTQAAPAAQEDRKHGHYFRDVSQLQQIDVYRVLEIFGVTDPCLQHAAKKILCAGQRGLKELTKDVGEARDTLVRRLEMWAEDFPVPQSELLPKLVPSMYQHFAPHQLRVVEERAELVARIHRLADFLNQAPSRVDSIEREMLNEQLVEMNSLQRTLTRRIDYWLAKIESDKKAGKL